MSDYSDIRARKDTRSVVSEAKAEREPRGSVKEHTGDA